MYITLFIYVAIVRDVLIKNIDLQKIIYFNWQRRWNEVLHENFYKKQPWGQEKDTHDKQENIFIGYYYKPNCSPWKDS